MHYNRWNTETRVFNGEENSDIRCQHSSHNFAVTFAGGYCLNQSEKRLSPQFFPFFIAEAGAVSKIYMIEGQLCK
jgi:hypothetical protein